MQLGPLRLSGLAVALVEVDVRSESVLQRVQRAHECYREDHDSFDQRNGEGKSLIMLEVPMNARLKSQKILMTPILLYPPVV